MAGVVNFILKRDFEGINLNAQAGLSSKGDRGTYRTSGTFGKNFADGRGNVALSLEYNRANMVTYTDRPGLRSEEHTSELQSLMHNSYAVFCLQKKTNTTTMKTLT